MESNDTKACIQSIAQPKRFCFIASVFQYRWKRLNFTQVLIYSLIWCAHRNEQCFAAFGYIICDYYTPTDK